MVHRIEESAGSAVAPASPAPESGPGGGVWSHDVGSPDPRPDRPAAARPVGALGLLDPVEALPPVGLDLPLGIDGGEVHVWYVFSDGVRDPELLAAYEGLLAPEERSQWQRFVFERDRHQYLVTRALVRTVLSRYAPVSPAEWRFARNDYGKPAICGPAGVLWPCFNLSHTRGLIACAVSASHQELGVDVEDTSRSGETVSLAEHFFSPGEVVALRALPEAARRERFFAYWTLKEAYIKARGMGLSIPLEQFSLHLEDGAPIRISFDPRLDDDPRRWQLALLRASAHHFLAVGARCDGQDLRLRARRWVPAPRPSSRLSGHP